MSLTTDDSSAQVANFRSKLSNQRQLYFPPVKGGRKSGRYH